MDHNVISIIGKYLSGSDIPRFALVNQTTYQYFNTTSPDNKPCTPVHTTYHPKLTILQELKLNYVMEILNTVKQLSGSSIPPNDFAVHMTLHKPCGTKVRLTFSRELVINSLIYTYSSTDVICDKYHGHLDMNSNVYYINANLERLRHKLYSIISHTYSKVDVKIIDNPHGDYRRDICEQAYTDLCKHFLSLIKII